MKKLRADNRGFTLLEVILSIAILAMISIPLMKYFSDSLRQTLRMEQKQKATLLAQDTIEKIKSQEKLIQPVLGADESREYWVPSISGENYADSLTAHDNIFRFESESVSGLTFDRTTGKGSLRLVRENYDFGGMQYDMVLDISTDLLVNERQQAVVHGIDDRKNALIVERDEEEEALTYFLAVNATYKLGTFMDGEGSAATPSGDATESSGGSTEAGAEEGDGEEGIDAADLDEEGDDGGDAGEGDDGDDAGDGEDGDDAGDGGGDAAIPQYETTAQIRKNVKREIYIDLGGTQVDLPSGGLGKYYTIKVHYKYICTKINDKDKVEYETGNIYESQMESLDSLYLLFNIFHPKEDVIYVNADDSVDLVGGEAPELILVCQNMDALLNGGEVEEGEGIPSVTFSDGKYTPKLILNERFSTWTGVPKIRTNIINEEAADEATRGAILKEDDTPYSNVENMDSLSADIVRVVSIDLRVYKANGYAGGEDPLVQMKTTKSE